MKKFVLSIMVLLSASFNIFACVCAPDSYFFQAVTNTPVDANAVLYIKVLEKHDDGSIDAQVLEVFKGEVDVSQIKIVGNDNCGPSLIGFDDGTKWIMPLAKQQNQYIHVACLDSLPVKDLTVTGFISERSEQSYSLEYFKKSWNTYISALPVDGVELTIAQCQASERHTTINGRYIDMENQCIDAISEPLGCMKIDTGCEDAIAVAQAPNGKKYWFSDLCIPDGWQILEYDGNIINLNSCPSLRATTFHSISLTWDIGQPDSTGFRLWRVLESGNGKYKNVVPLQEVNSFHQDGNCVKGRLINSYNNIPSKPITKVANNVCYSFMEIEVGKNRTYYYVLEEIDKNGNSIFHCNDIAPVSIEDGLPINLKTIQDYCRQVTGS